MSLYATHFESNQELAKKCHQLSKELSSLKKVEQVSFCKSEIDDASSFSEMAGKDIIVNNLYSAKSALELAVQALAYSTVEECTQATSIDKAKNELQKIHDELFMGK